MTKPKSKKRPTIPRSSKASRIAEESSVGGETIDWLSVPVDQYRNKLHETLNHYNYFYDHNDAFNWATQWVSENRDKQSLKYFKQCTVTEVSPTIGRFCRIISNGGQITDKEMAFIERKVDEAIARGKAKSETSNRVDVSNRMKKSPAEIVKENASDFIANIEQVLDTFDGGTYVDWGQYSVFNELKSVDAPYLIAKRVYQYYKPLQEEIQKLVDGGSKELEEGYSHLSKRKRNKLLKIVNQIVDDAEKYMITKKAVRKTRKKKQSSTTQQVAKVKYMQQSDHYKVASINPSEIVGAQELYLFNTKYKRITYLVSSSKQGFTVKGTTVQNIDFEQSFQKTVRKPEQFLTELIKTPKVMSRKTLSEHRTKPSDASGRINEHTIILKKF